MSNDLHGSLSRQGRIEQRFIRVRPGRYWRRAALLESDIGAFVVKLLP